jgi:predicted O-methyltransferase YrrM
VISEVAFESRRWSGRSTITLSLATVRAQEPQMFHAIQPEIRARMSHLEERDARDREDGTPRLERLRQIPPETGRFIALWAAAAPPGLLLEIGTSAGYSTLWLALAARAKDCRVTTYEVLPEKAALARETFTLAGVDDVVDLVEGDFLDARQPEGVGFCFLDAEKEAYRACYEAVVPQLVPGGILIADNAINHRETLQPMLDAALADSRVDAMVAPIGKGELVCRKL